MEEHNIIIRLSDDLPARLPAVCVYCGEDDSYNVYLNAHCSVEEQREGLNHEMIHIQRQDFWRSANEAENRIYL